MSDPSGFPFQLPVFHSVGLALRWTIAIVLRHWWAVGLFAVVLVLGQWVLPPTMPVIGQPIEPNLGSSLSQLATFVFYVVGGTVVAILTHNEVLRGPSGFDAATLGHGPGRVLGYLVDGLIASVVPILGLMSLMGLASAAIWMVAGVGAQAVGALGVVVFFAGFLGVAGTVCRLLLRLPSRALGRTEAWGDIWRMGRNNTWRLFAGHVLLSLLFFIPVALVSLPLLATLGTWRPVPGEPLPEPPLLLSLVAGVLTPIEIILFCAFLSVAYLQLRHASQTSAPGIGSTSVPPPEGD